VLDRVQMGWEGATGAMASRRGVLDMTLCDGYEAPDEVALLPGCAERRGELGGEAVGLEVENRRGDFSLKFRAADGGLGIESISARVSKRTGKEREAAAWGFYRGGERAGGGRVRGRADDRRPGGLPCTPRAPARARGRPDRWAHLSVSGKGKRDTPSG
jgi:hypothetical protein